MEIDPIMAMAAVRVVRDDYATRFGYDVEAIFRDIRSSQEASDRKYVRYPARRVVSEFDDRATP